MGKRKQSDTGERKNISKISSVSKKLAVKKLEQLNPGGLSEIKCQTREPLAPIASENDSANLAHHLDNCNEDNFDKNNSSGQGGGAVEQSAGENSVMMTKQPMLLDDNIFTFKPKVSTASARLVENLGTDFMTRQQQHLEKQKKLIEQAGYSLKTSSGPLSPLSRFKKLKERGFQIEENENVNGNSNDTEEPPPPSSPSDKTDGDELLTSGDTMPPALHRNKTSVSPSLQRILDGPYANGNPDMVLKRQKTRLRSSHRRSAGDSGSDFDDIRDDMDSSSTLSRSKTMPALMRPKLTRKITNLGNSDRLKNAKELAEKAIKLKKVFTIQGGYSAVRHSLRKRGWVEKFYRIPGPPKKSTRKRQRDGDDDDDDDDDDDGDDDDDVDDNDSDNDQPKVPPWEEDDGIYGIMSRLVRNVNPTFIWVLKRDVIDYRFLTKDQMVNHYCKAGSFTTKVGLCVNMRQVPWFEEANPDEFYPRCYRLSHEEEKSAFIDDFRLTACISILKIVINMYMEGGECNEERREKEDNPEKKEAENAEPEIPFVCTNPECTRSRPNMETENLCVHAKLKKEEEDRKKQRERERTILASDNDENSGENIGENIGENTADSNNEDECEVEYDENGVPKPLDSSRRKKKKRVIVPQKCLDRAMVQCEKYLQFSSHEDIDQTVEPHQLSPAQWDELTTWYYQLAHDGGIIPNVPANILGQTENLLNRVKAVCPQYELDGIKNVWIVKPGAKSRGRGIVCYDRLDDMLKLVSSQVVRKDNKYVVQKYIERPLLVYNCKFDIRQWFLVTDWNPLTLYFYQDSYLRFCSQQFTLDDYDESIHLSNNAIQKHYKNGPRSKELPDENMWTHEEFSDYIKGKKLGNLWDEMIYPSMKKAIVCALLSTQDLVEYRKASFELYGADFMLTEDYKPWLIEINSSPSMECSTEVTARLCANVLEDTMKVVIDRKWDRNCDIGRFELAFKQPVVTVPPYIGISLCVDGQAIKKPSWMNVRKNNESEALFSPRKEKQVIFHDKLNNITNTETNKMCITNQRRPKSDKDNEEVTYQKHSSSAPVKKSSSRETCEQGQLKVRRRTSEKSPTSGTSATQIVSGTSIEKSESGSAYSRSRSRIDKEESEMRVEKPVMCTSPREKQVGSPILPKTSTFGSGAIPASSYIASLGAKKIVSRTSVSTNYSIPSDKQEQPALSVNNVETTDLKTLKAQAKGKRRRRRFGIGRSVPVYKPQDPNPIKLHFTKGMAQSPYMVVQKLPVIKVHILNHGL